MSERKVAFEAAPGPQSRIFSSPAQVLLGGGGKKSGKALTPDHDVLTAHRGWVPIGLVRRGDVVIGLKQDNAQDRGRLVYATVEGTYVQDHDGPVLSSKYRPYFKASPDHRWLVSEPTRKPPRTADNWRYMTSSQIGNGSKGVLRVPVTGEPLVRDRGPKWTDAEMELWGWYIAEGCKGDNGKGSQFSQFKAEGRERICKLLKRIPGATCKPRHGTINSSWTPPIDCGRDCYSKFIPRIALMQPNVWKLIEGFIGGDGERCRDGYIAATASKQLADDIQEASILCGWRAMISPKPNKYINSPRPIKNGKGRVKNATNYRVNIRPRRWANLSQKYLRWDHYKGKTHCLLVPETSNFIARHKGSAFVTGNTQCAVARPTPHIGDPRFRCVFLRRTIPGLRYMEGQARKLYKAICPEVEHNRTNHIFTFPHPTNKGEPGAQILFTFAESMDDCDKLEGWGYQMLIVDEARQYPDPLLITTLAAELYAENDPRTGKPWMDTLLLLLSNPGGAGGDWLREWFAIDKHPKGGELIYNPNTSMYHEYVHMTVKDNPHVDTQKYIAQLKSFPIWKQHQMISGDWFQKEGSAFEEFDEKIHEIPVDSFKRKGWEIHRSCDWGYSTVCIVHWWAVNPDYNATVCIDERSFTRTKPRDVARAILQLESDRGYVVENAVMDPSAWGEDTSGLSPAMAMMSEDVMWRRAINNREGGYRAMCARLGTRIRLHSGLSVPAIRLLEGRCPVLRRTLPTLPQKPGEDDVDKIECKRANAHKGIDHAYDSARYHVMSLPMPEEEPEQVERFAGVPDYKPDRGGEGGPASRYAPQGF